MEKLFKVRMFNATISFSMTTFDCLHWMILTIHFVMEKYDSYTGKTSLWTLIKISRTFMQSWIVWSKCKGFLKRLKLYKGLIKYMRYIFWDKNIYKITIKCKRISFISKTFFFNFLTEMLSKISQVVQILLIDHNQFSE